MVASLLSPTAPAGTPSSSSSTSSSKTSAAGFDALGDETDEVATGPQAALPYRLPHMRGVVLVPPHVELAVTSLTSRGYLQRARVNDSATVTATGHGGLQGRTRLTAEGGRLLMAFPGPFVAALLTRLLMLAPKPGSNSNTARSAPAKRSPKSQRAPVLTKQTSMGTYIYL